ncbi:MAG: leucine-rich repeat protein [Muribaculaceae bacterium]|nr:leucine-rich repeat protein [Muribaculaceae bacterium]
MNHLTSNIFKRWLAMLSLIVGISLGANAASVNIDGLYYELNSPKTGEATLTYQNTTTSNYSSLPVSVVVPERVTYNNMGYAVTTIGKSAFSGCSKLESISIPGSITKLGVFYQSDSNPNSSSSDYESVFKDCTSLKRVRFEDGCSFIDLGLTYYKKYSTTIAGVNIYGRGLFADCPLEEIYIGRNIRYNGGWNGQQFVTTTSPDSYYGYSAFFNQTKLEKVTIGPEVTALPDYLFYKCPVIKDVSFGESITSVSSHAFDGCTSLTSAMLPNSVTNIGSYSFKNCTSIQSVSLGHAVNIGEYAFYNNSSLKNLTMSPDLQTVGDYGFYGTTNLEDISLPPTLISIGNYTFSYSGINDIIIPSSVNEIGNNAFQYSKLQSARFGDGWSSIGSACFANSSLQNVVIGDKLIKISSNCFEGCTNLKDIHIGSNVTTIDKSAFSGCSKLESISIPAGVTQLGVFYHSDSNPNSSSSDYESVFKDCTSLKRVRFEDGCSFIDLGLTYYKKYSTTIAGVNIYGRGLFADCPLEEIYIGRNIRYNGGWNGQQFVTTTSPDSYYGYSAFFNQTKLEKVTIGPEVTALPDYLFYKCPDIKDIIDLATTPNSVGSNVFHSYSSTLYYPLESESKYAAADVWKLFDNKYGMYSEGNMLFIPTAASEAMVTLYPGSSPETLAVPATINSNGTQLTVTKVMDKAFEACPDLTLVQLPATLTEIGEEAFARNIKLSSITFNGQKVIGKGAFADCPSITSLTLPNSLETIADRAFKNNTGITSVSFGTGLKNIENEAFYGCSALTAARMPEMLDTIKPSAFENCVKLTYVSLGSNLKCLGNRAFFNNKVLTEIEIPGTTTSIGSQAFENCTNLSLATLNNGIETIGGNCFKSCESLITISIPGTVNSIGDNSFDGCTSLSTLTFAAGEEELYIPYFTHSPLKTLRIGRNLKYAFGEDASPFKDKASLTRVSFTGNFVTNLYNNLLDGCTGIASISLPNTLESINGYAFRNCTKLSEIVVPEGVTTVGEHCFENCTSLTSVSLPTTLKILENHLFNNCNKLESFVFQPTMETVKEHCFDQCLSLRNLRFEDGTSPITLSTVVSMFGDTPLEEMYVGRNIDYKLPDKVKEVPFFNRSSLTNVTISNEGGVTYLRPYFIFGASTLPRIDVPDNVLEIGKYAFAECSSLEEAVLSKNLSIIDEGLFDQDIALKSLIIPAAVNNVNKFALRACGALKDLRFEDSANPLTAAIARSNTGMCGDTHLENLYIGRNIRYDSDSNSGNSPFYSLSTLKNVTFSTAGVVTECNDYLLSGCSAVENLTLPESLATLGNYTFSDMTSLQYCRMFDNVESVGEYGFAGDENLTDLTFSKKVKTLRNNLFMNCASLPIFTVHPAVTSIEDNAFMNCSSLATLSFTDSSDLLNIGRRNENGSYAAMFSDSPIESLYLSRWLIYNIDEESYAPFYNRSTLTDLRFGETLGDIGKFLFEKCSSIATVNIPGVESIGEKAFYDCTALSGLTFNSGTKSLGEQTFANCTALKNVVLPPTVVSVSDGCFMNDNELATLDLGNSLEIIGPSAFSGCASLSELNFPKTLYGLGVESFKGCKNLSYVTIPDGCRLSSIGARAFQNCAGIEWVSLSDKITSLGANSFDGCSSIRYIKSFNIVPPVGLPNFSENVIENSTVFVPAESLDDYKDADLWWEFFNIRPIGDGVFVTYLNLDKTEVSMKASETLQLVADAGPSTATDTSVGFSSDNLDIATVDSDGVITAVAVGEANIKAFAKDGSGFYKICKITVVPTLMGSIELDNSSLTLRANREATLTAQIFPVTTTNKEIIWSSSNSSVAIVDSEGNIVTKYKGNATIKATAADGSGVMASCELTVLPPLTGDSNDNDAVTITDAVNTANYAVGNEVENFCFEAADVNGDNRVTVADASATIGIILEQETVSASQAMARTIMQEQIIERDILSIDDYEAQTGETLTLSVALDNSFDYVALQADIKVPEGLSLVDVKIGERASANHSLITRRMDDRSMRIVLFDMANNVFESNNEDLLELVVKVNAVSNEDIELFNILASDAQANEYALTSMGGHNTSISGNDTLSFGKIRIETTSNSVNILNAEGCEVAIFAADGTMLSRFKALSDVESRQVVAGIYLVVAGNTIEKVIVK